MAQKWAVKFARLQEKLEYDGERKKSFNCKETTVLSLLRRNFSYSCSNKPISQSTLYNKGSRAMGHHALIPVIIFLCRYLVAHRKEK